MLARVVYFFNTQYALQNQMLQKKNEITGRRERKFIEMESSPSMYYKFWCKSRYDDVFFFLWMILQAFLKANMVSSSYQIKNMLSFTKIFFSVQESDLLYTKFINKYKPFVTLNIFTKILFFPCNTQDEYFCCSKYDSN